MNLKPEYICVFNPDIITITEIYPKHSLYELTITELNIDGYDIFYNDTCLAHRGVCIFILKHVLMHT